MNRVARLAMANAARLARKMLAKSRRDRMEAKANERNARSRQHSNLIVNSMLEEAQGSAGRAAELSDEVAEMRSAVWESGFREKMDALDCGYCKKAGAIQAEKAAIKRL